MMRLQSALLGFISALLFCPVLASSAGQDVTPSETTIVLDPVVTTGLSSPVLVTNARDNSNRLFIVEQPGRVQVLQPNASVPTTFLDITAKVLSGGERGLLGLAFHPNFTANRRFFVNYTRRPDGATVIAEYRASVANANVADVEEKVLLVIDQPFANHNGGMIEFGRDGYLYIGMGDGGSGNDPGNRAQNLNDLLGKMLRINIDQGAGQTPYSSPTDNPFAGDVFGRDEIYAYGLRNPWRWSFDRLTGELCLADVGQSAIEEINIITKGGNYGWKVLEGTRCTGNGTVSCTSPGFIPPIAEYGRAGGRCSITGGYVYRGTRSSLPFGTYVFGDYCTGEILMLMNGAQMPLLDTSLNISSFGEDEAGELYVVGLGGAVYRIRNPVATEPPPSVEFRITDPIVRRRKNGELIQPVTPRPNGKKFDLIVSGTATPPVAGSAAAEIYVNGQQVNTEYSVDATGRAVYTGRLRRFMLATVGTLIIEVVRADGIRSNQLTVPVIPE